MKFSINQYASCIRFLLILLAALLLHATIATADLREDVESAVARLQGNTVAGKFADDMKSLDLVYEVALRYSMTGDQENADKFFLLALQKSWIIEVLVKESEVVLSPDATDVAPASEPELSADSTRIKPAADPAEEVNSTRLVGARGVYTTVKADSIRLVSAKLGVTQQHLRKLNHLDTKATLKVGQKLAYNNRKIIPQQIRDGIIVNIPDRTLYYFQHGVLVTSLPVAVGSATKNEKYVWQTPVGKFKITAKIKDPTWTVPTSIQTQMEEQGKEVITTLAAGPENPLGKYAIKTSIPGILIHSTTRPASIYSFSSHGCIRLSPAQMEDFFPKIKVSTKGEIIYKPVKLVVTENGRVFLEVHNDVYNKHASIIDEARQMVEKQKLSKMVDWKKFESVVKQKNGVAEDISL